jgi:uncharacterized membrane protein
MKRLELAIGRLLLVSVIVSFILVVIGGSAYLLKQGTDTVYYNSFRGEPQVYKSIIGIFSNALTFAPLGLIQLGLLILVIAQLLRVGMTAWLFIQSKEIIFAFISLFILVLLLYNISLG